MQIGTYYCTDFRKIFVRIFVKVLYEHLNAISACFLIKSKRLIMQIYMQLINLVYFRNLRQIFNLNLRQKNVVIMYFYSCDIINAGLITQSGCLIVKWYGILYKRKQMLLGLSKYVRCGKQKFLLCLVIGRQCFFRLIGFRKALRLLLSLHRSLYSLK